MHTYIMQKWKQCTALQFQRKIINPLRNIKERLMYRVGRVLSFSPVAGECAPPPPPPGSVGRGTLAESLVRQGLGESQFRRGDIHCDTLYIYVLCGLMEHNMSDVVHAGYWPVGRGRGAMSWFDHAAVLQLIGAKINFSSGTFLMVAVAHLCATFLKSSKKPVCFIFLYVH